jgi:hypothetical protein
MSANEIIIDCVWYAELATLAMLLFGYSVVTIGKRFPQVFNTLIRLLYVPVILRSLYPFTTEYNGPCGTMRNQYISHSALLIVAFLPMCTAVLIRREYRIAAGLMTCAVLPFLFAYIM